MGQLAERVAAFDIYGLRVEIGGDWPEVIEDVRLDFAWFARPDATGPADVVLRVERRAPSFDSFGEITASYITPRNVVYQRNGRRIVDYFGRAICVVDETGVTVQGEERHLVHEAAYLYLLSRVGEHLDLTRRPRLHALGLTSGDGAVAVMLPSGGGKSTLALRALQADGVRILSEDTPLIDRRGRLHPFPLRIGINATDADRLPADHVRRIERMEFHPKLVLDLDRFADRIERNPQPLRHLVVGRRSLGTEARLEPLPRRGAAGVLLREAVVGVGVYQGMEFILQRGPRDLMEKAGIVGTRALCCAGGLARAQTWQLTLGRDHERNWAALAPLLNGRAA
jgi:hypothetical protein